MSEESQVKVIRMGDGYITRCFRCEEEFSGEVIGIDMPSKSVDLHPDCARALGQELLDATKGEPTP